MSYVIKSVRGKDGSYKDKRKGRKGDVVELEIGRPMLFRYTEGEGVLNTSLVEAHSPAEWEDAPHIVVQTENSIYTLHRKGDRY